MKYKKPLKIQFKSLDDLEKELLALPESNYRYIQPKDVIIFESINGFRNFMTMQKLEILTMIAFAKPKSIYELAKMVERSLAPVQKDCQTLCDTGFITLVKEKNGRQSLRPKLKFDYDTIIVETSSHPYELSFKIAA